MQRRHALLAALATLPALAQARQPDYQLVRADYGTARRNIDVTPVVAELVRRGQSAQVNNALFGSDPAEGQRKRLRVVGRDRRGRERSIEVGEDGWFDASSFWAGESPDAGPGDDGGWRIQHARYGVAGAHVDVTQRLRELARGDQRFRLANETFGVDPAPGVPKTLRIVARDSSGRRRSFEYAEGSWVDGSQFSGWGSGNWGNGGGGDWDDGWSQGGWDGGPTRPPAGLRIERAEYSSGDGRGFDVTERLQQMADTAGGRLDLRVNNRSLGGDPAPGRPKTLRVRWRVGGGRAQERQWREDERLRLP